jgi:hypothetical protein
MTEARKKHDKPDDPNYAGGEDESPGSGAASAEQTQKQKNFRVGENDTPEAPYPTTLGKG